VPRLRGGARSRLAGIPGDPPPPAARPPGCAFAPRCARAVERCSESLPELSACIDVNLPGAAQGGSTAPVVQPGLSLAAVACHCPLHDRAQGA
jgi:Oligopeptide/dipeptide transporter, C-terminal region